MNLPEPKPDASRKSDREYATKTRHVHAAVEDFITQNVVQCRCRELRCPGKQGILCAGLTAPVNPVSFGGATSTWEGS